MSDEGSFRRNPRGSALIRLALRSLTATFFILAAVLLLSQHLRTLDWPGTLGTVEEVVVARSGTEGDSRAPGERFVPRVAYRYEAEGQRFRGTTVAVFDWIFPNRERARAYLDEFAITAGARVPVYYNPEHPEEAILIRHIPIRRLEVIGVFLFLVVLPLAVVLFSLLDLLRDGTSRRNDGSRGRFW